MRLVGERVVLRPTRPEDADTIAQGFADDPTMGAMLGMEPDQENAEWLRGTVLLVGWAQGELGLHRIELHTLPENAPMQGLAEAAGFTREGVLRDYAFERGHLVDNVVYARLPAP